MKTSKQLRRENNIRRYGSSQGPGRVLQRWTAPVQIIGTASVYAETKEDAAEMLQGAKVMVAGNTFDVQVYEIDLSGLKGDQ